MLMNMRAFTALARASTPSSSSSSSSLTALGGFGGYRTVFTDSGYKVLMFGSDGVSLEVLKELFKNFDDNEGKIAALEVVSGRKYSEFEASEFERYAKDHGLRVHHFHEHDGSKWNVSPFPEPGLLVKGGFDLAVVASFPHRIPDDYLSQFSMGAINMHPSLLPRYRGPAPVYRAMLDGESESGITIATVDKNIDTGFFFLFFLFFSFFFFFFLFFSFFFFFFLFFSFFFFFFLFSPPPFSPNQTKPNQIKSNQIKSNQIKSNQIKSNQIKSNQTKSNQTKPNQTKPNQTKH